MQYFIWDMIKKTWSKYRVLQYEIKTVVMQTQIRRYKFENRDNERYMYIHKQMR